MTTTASPRLRTAAARFDATNAAAERFFAEQVDAIALTCQDMAERFQADGRLLVAGDAAQRSDVAHVVVEFLHPVVTGKRALPTMALPAIAGGGAERALQVLSAANDMLLVLVTGALDADARTLLDAARGRGLLTILLAGEGMAERAAADHLLMVPSRDACVVQETHEVVYHVLWELVHVFFEHRGVRA